jgi:hypothetical protein
MSFYMDINLESEEDIYCRLKWHRSIIPALGWLRQGDYKFKVSQGSIA